jgi:Cu-Zn family superoxide dismutase
LRYASKLTLPLALLAALALAACGSSGDDEAATVSGQVKPLPRTPAGDRFVTGEASLKRADGGTTVSLDVTRLRPDTEYVAHLHTGGCDQADPGGPHFKFDAEGADEPPNEIHLEFSSSAAGAGKATASNDREVPAGEAGSIVIHEAGSEDMTAGAADVEGETVLVHEGHDHDEPSVPEKIACAELEGGSGDASGSTGENPESASMGGKVPSVVVRDGEPVGGIAELGYEAGDQIRFEVSSDVADEVHVHGYELIEDVAAGGTVSFDFPAEIEGIFEVELEGRKVQIAELRVNP